MISSCIKEISPVKVAVVYIAVINGGMIDSYAPRFAQTYKSFPAGIEHSLTVICNGGELNQRRLNYFNGLNCSFGVRENDPGWDISSYRDAAANTDADLLVCFGESVYFHRAGWLARIVEAYQTFGHGMYGLFATHAVRAHLNTTAFAVDPQFLVKYPPVTNHGQRYEFEHGTAAMWRRIKAGGGAAIFVTWDGFWQPGKWRIPENILNKGDGSNLLVRCNHTSRWDAANPATQASWQSGADQPFQ